ncbi:MAG: hypothetical protein ACK56K_07380 [Akkermansiaceae bacterium]
MKNGKHRDDMLRWIFSLKLPALIAYLCFCVVISGFALGSFAKIIQEYLTTTYDYRTEGLMVLGQVAFQWSFMGNASWSKRKGYAIIALTVSMIGSLLLLPLIACHNIFTVSVLLATVYFFAVVTFIFAIHHSLIRTEKLPTILTYTWVLYRILLLIYLVFPREGHYG